jgi:hypothetical protein
MSAASSRITCKHDLCTKSIPRALATEELCLDHFLDEAFVRTERAFQVCRARQPVDSKGLEWLLADALTIVNNLEEGASEPNPTQRDRMLELLLILANLHEYVAHRSARIERLA